MYRPFVIPLRDPESYRSAVYLGAGGEWIGPPHGDSDTAMADAEAMAAWLRAACSSQLRERAIDYGRQMVAMSDNARQIMAANCAVLFRLARDKAEAAA